MNIARFQKAARILIATTALGGLALIGIAAAPVGAAGLRNCVDIAGPQSGRVACYEKVWADGSEVRMTFSNQSFDGAKPGALDPFYVVAAQTGTPQGAPPNTFAHDHVVRSVPSQNHGQYSVQVQGFFVVCSGQGLVSGACVPVWTSLGGDPMPLAGHVDSQPLTSTEAVESAASAGNVVLINLGPGAVMVGTVTSAN
jgi:hypothetical protein